MAQSGVPEPARRRLTRGSRRRAELQQDEEGLCVRRVACRGSTALRRQARPLHRKGCGGTCGLRQMVTCRGTDQASQHMKIMVSLSEGHDNYRKEKKNDPCDIELKLETSV